MDSLLAALRSYSLDGMLRSAKEDLEALARGEYPAKDTPKKEPPKPCHPMPTDTVVLTFEQLDALGGIQAVTGYIEIYYDRQLVSIGASEYATMKWRAWER